MLLSELMEPGKRRRKKIKETGLTYKGYPCTVDCMGHHAGHEWATHWGIDDPEECPYGTSNSFWEGCKSKSEEREPEELEEMAGKVHGDIRKALKEKGYKYLGSGIDKQAWLEPGSGKVLIVFGYRKGHPEDFSPDQRMFIDWIKYCNQHKNNLHLPRFSGFESFQFQGKNYIQARMEALQELPPNVRSIVNSINILRDKIAAAVNAPPKFAATPFDPVFDELSEIHKKGAETIIRTLGGRRSAEELLRTVHTVREFGENHGFNIDLHAGNYMGRSNGTIVVNDPFVLWLGGSGG